MAENPKQKDVLAQMATLAAAANADPNKLPALQQYMAEHDDIFDTANLLLTTARNSLIRKVAGTGEGSQALYLRETDALKDKLTQEDDSPLVQLMIDRAVMCFLRASLAEMKMTVAKGLTLDQYEYLDEDLTRAHNRFLRACESLERVRLLTQATRYAEAKADLAEAKAAEIKIQESKAALALVKAANS